MSLPWYIDPDKIDGTNENGALVAKNIRGDDSVAEAVFQYGVNINADYVPEDVINRFHHSGMKMIDEVNAMEKDLIIDLGCGFNPFIKYIKNCIGADVLPYKDINIQSDFAHTPFIDDCADVCLCLTGQFFRFINNEKALTEIRRIAKDGCIIYCRTPKQKFRKLKKKILGTRRANDALLAKTMGEKYGFEIRTELEVEIPAYTVCQTCLQKHTKAYLKTIPTQHYHWTWTVRK